MAIEFNGKGNVNNFRIGKEVPGAKDVQKEEKVEEQKQVADNKFVKDLGEDLLTSTAASAYGINFAKPAGEHCSFCSNRTTKPTSKERRKI